MADILSQDEVDLLLSAVSKGEVGASTAAERPAMQSHVATYDFRRPEGISKDQLKGLQSRFEECARELSVVLPPFLRTVVRVDLISIDQLTYDEFTLSISRPTALSVVDLTPLEGQAVIELSPSVVFPIVDRVLGGKGVSLGEYRELTEIESRIAHRIVVMILDCLKRAWEQIIEFEMTVAHQESDPLIVQIVAGSEMVILVGYEVHVGETVGTINICIPLMVLNPLLEQIRQQMGFMRRMAPAMEQAARAHIARTLRRAQVPVEALLGHAQLLLSDLARLQVGDVVQLDTGVSAPLLVEVGGVPRFRAKAGRRGEQSAIQVTGLVKD